MSGANSFGHRLRLTSFGESHGAALGAVIDGMPAGITWCEDLLLSELARRRPGTSSVVSARTESDQPEVLSGVHEGRTLGTPIAIIVRNHDARSADYKMLPQRAGHADDMWKIKFGLSDARGGGRASGRETVARVMGGAVAKMFLNEAVPALRITGFALQIGTFHLQATDLAAFQDLIDVSAKGANPADAFTARFPSRARHLDVETYLSDAKEQGLSYGGVAEVWIDGVPAGLGQPVFHKLKADLAAAMMSVGATTNFELGDGGEAVASEGSEFHNRTDPARYGGIRGGIATGERIVFRVGFKPTSSVLDVAKKGRHDPCIVPRAIPVLEAMAALVIADHVLWMRTDR